MIHSLVASIGLVIAANPPEALEACALRVAKSWPNSIALPASKAELSGLTRMWGESVERGEVLVGFGLRLHSLGADACVSGDDLTSLIVLWSSVDCWDVLYGDVWSLPPTSKYDSMFDFEEGRRAITMSRMNDVVGTFRRNARLGSVGFAELSRLVLPDDESLDGWGNEIRLASVLFVCRAVDYHTSREIDSPSGEPRWRAYVLPETNKDAGERVPLECIIGDAGARLSVRVVANTTSPVYLDVDGWSYKGFTRRRGCDVQNGRGSVEFGRLSAGPLVVRVYHPGTMGWKIVTTKRVRIDCEQPSWITIVLHEVRFRVIVRGNTAGRRFEVRLEGLDPLGTHHGSGDSAIVRAGEEFSLIGSDDATRITVREDSEVIFSKPIVLSRQSTLDLEVD
jgi:hypothetical protein